jgi:hypothetical protein
MRHRHTSGRPIRSQVGILHPVALQQTHLVSHGNSPPATAQTSRPRWTPGRLEGHRRVVAVLCPEQQQVCRSLECCRPPIASAVTRVPSGECRWVVTLSDCDSPLHTLHLHSGSTFCCTVMGLTGNCRFSLSTGNHVAAPYYPDRSTPKAPSTRGLPTLSRHSLRHVALRAH